MIDTATETGGSPPAGHPADGRPGIPPRRRVAYLVVGVLLAGLVAAVLVSAGRSTTGGAVAVVSGPPDQLPGITPATANLISLSVFGASSRAAADFHLSDQNGRPVSLDQFRGKTVVLSFNDDRCTDVCTLLAEDVVRADQYLGSSGAGRVQFLSVNVNPYFPRVADVKQWTDANDLGATANWTFATGPVAALESVWKKYGVYVGADARTRTVIHSATIELIGPDGHVRAAADFGQNAVDVAPYSHGLAQAAMDLLPASERTPVAGPQAPEPGGVGAGVGQQAPAFSLPALGRPGAPVSLAGLRGHPVVVNFWASSCQDCRAELHSFAAVAEAEPGIRFLGVDVADPSTAAAESLARSAGVTYPLLDDRGGRVAASYRVTGLPTTVYVDPSGRVVVVHPGAMTAEQLRYTLDQFFPKQTAPAPHGV